LDRVCAPVTRLGRGWRARFLLRLGRNQPGYSRSVRVWLSILVLLLAIACEGKSKSDREISKQMDMTDVRTGKTETCVAGDEATCTHAGGRWAGGSAQCCSPKASCAFGDPAPCAHAKGTWTGKYCCLAPEYRLVPGDEANCTKLRGVWTGTD